MNTDRELMQQALEALVAAYQGKDKTGQVTEAITALRAALAEPEQGPDGISWLKRDSGYFTAPTPRKPEQPYDQTALDLCKVCGWRTMIPGDACLNCERSKQPEQEPVAWSFEARHIDSAWAAAVTLKHPGPEGKYMRKVTPLYTSPPQRKPLTEEEIDSIWDSEKAFADIYAIVRAIERAHGIGEKPDAA